MALETQGRAPQASAELLAAQNLVLEMIALGSPLEKTLRALASYIELLDPAGACCLFLLQADGRTLQLAVASKAPETFADVSEQRLMCGAAGAAASSRKRVLVPDIASHPLYANHRARLLDIGLRSCWATPILSSDGSALGVAGVYYDRLHTPRAPEIGSVERATWLARIAIERRRFEQRLESTEEYFRSLIEHTSDLIVLLDESGTIRYASLAAERVTGFRPEELVETDWFDRIHPDDLGPARLATEAVLARPGCAPTVERRFRHKDGSWRMLEITCNNQLADRAVAGVIVTAHDITDRKAAEEELISSQDRYRELFENANDIVYMHDLDGTLTSLNRAGELVTGYSREEALGTNIAEYLAPEYHGIRREMTERKLGGEPRTTYELEIVSKQGDRILLDVSTRLVFQNGRPVAVQGIARDVTERRRLETHLSQAQKMEAIGRLAGGVAHDFNNLLTVITGYSQWLLEEIPLESPLAGNASEILAATSRAAALTTQLLAFSRNQIIQPIVMDVNSVVTQLDQMLRRVIGEDIELAVRTARDLGLVRADPVQIEQLILNLVVNARDAMADGGRLTIETGNVRIAEESTADVPGSVPGDYVLLAVSDSGCGIEQQVKAHIFEPFFTTKEVGKGTGLGLSTVYGIVKQSGGHIRVDSEPGAGARFRIYLPQVAGAEVAASAAPRPGPRPAGGSETILLVEDERAVRRVVGQMLLRLGYTVIEAADVDAARRLIVEHDKPIQLLLTDIVMPRLSGRELARQLIRLRPELKVMFISGYADDSMVNDGRAEAGAAFLRKPFTPAALAAKIREALDS